MVNIKLVDPSMEYFESQLEAIHEGFPYFWNGTDNQYSAEQIKEMTDDPEEFIRTQNKFSSQEYTAPDGTKFTFERKRHWIIDTDTNEYVGEITLCPGIKDDFLIYAGTTGYAIRPSARRKGYASSAVKLSMDYTRQHYPDMKEIVICVAPTNISSEGVVKKNGGQDCEIVDAGHGFGMVKRFRIPL